MTRRRSPKVAERDATIERAIAALSQGDFPNINQAPEHFNLNYVTLKNRYNGRKSIAEYREPSQLLTITKEHALVRWIR